MTKKPKTKLLLIDLDDTLIGPDLRVSPRNRNAIRQATRAGLIVTLATGRTFTTTLPFALKLGLKHTLACFQGALLRGRSKILASRTLPPQHYLDIIKFGLKHRVQICVYVLDHDTVFFQRPLDRYGKEYLDKIEQVRQISLVNLLTFPFTHPPIKIMFVAHPEKIIKLERLAQKRFGRKLYITRTRNTLLEFLHPQVNKGFALRKLAEHYHLRLKQTAAIGDGYNDIPLLKTAGLSFAVKNAPAKVERSADRVVSAWDQDGVAEAIEQIIK
ncbi:HAD family phosphatase [Candidatus Parcubacteria bacterium]|jgi:Cof subfamily protein (haloacid dehalogenase superfamily)|nr:MAG: HAD family phosphatase [Candidatus Parcubacteria bacterium]